MDWNAERLAAWYGTREGRALAREVAGALKGLPEVPWVGSLRLNVLGVGYVDPFTGVWPGAQVEEADWEDARSECRYDRILVAHALEVDPAPAALLDLCWKSLRPDGVLIVMAPHWLGWHRWRDGPLAAGEGYGAKQLARALEGAGFRNVRTTKAGGMLVAASHKEVLQAKALRRNAKSGVVQPVPVGVATCRGN
jgi:SAM-dependent methyltransferase